MQYEGVRHLPSLVLSMELVAKVVAPEPPKRVVVRYRTRKPLRAMEIVGHIAWTNLWFASMITSVVRDKTKDEPYGIIPLVGPFISMGQDPGAMEFWLASGIIQCVGFTLGVIGSAVKWRVAVPVESAGLDQDPPVVTVLPAVLGPRAAGLQFSLIGF